MKKSLFLKKTCAVAALLSCGHLGFAQLSGIVSVGSGQTYTSLTGAGGLFSAINTLGMSGNVTVTITSDLSEDGSVTLNDFTAGGTNNYRLTIVPDGTTIRSITNSGSPAVMMKLSGVSNLKIDGSVDGAGRYLRFSSNTATTSAYTIQLAGTATAACSNDTIKNCIIEGANINQSQTATGGIIGLIATGTANGVTNSAILNNLISSPNTYSGTASATVMAGTGIASVTGTTASVTNSNILIDNNEFANCQWNGIVQGSATTGTAGSNFTITNNSFYFTVSPAGASGIRTGVYIRSGQNHTVANNWIGGSAAQAGGTSPITFSSSNSGGFYALYLAGTATSLVNVSGNTVSNIYVPSGSFYGVYVSSAAVGNISGNTIQKAGTTTAGVLYGIYSAAANTKITNNIIGGVGSNGLTGAGNTAVGIYGSGSKDTITDNVIRNISSSTVNTSSTDANGIYIAGASPYIHNNTIDSIVGNNTSNTGNQAVLGINMTAGVVSGTPSIVSHNTITNIINTNTTGTTAYANSVSGIAVLNPTTTAPVKFEGNYIAKIYGYNNTAGNNISGILENNNATAGTDTFINNVVILDSAKVPNGWIKCLHASAGAASVTLYNNTFVVGNMALTANNASGKGGAYCLSTNSSIKFYLYNNIISNLSTTTGTAQPFAFMNLTNNIPSTSNMMSSYNLVYTADTSKLFGAGTSTINTYNLSGWKTLVSDTNSTVGQAPFVSLLDCHLNTANANAWNVYGRGIATPLVDEDKDGNLRSTTMGIPNTLGAYEIAMPTVAPAAMTMVPAAPVAGTPTIFYSNGRKIAEINWDAAATVPSSISATYYPGVPVPGSPYTTNVNSYFNILQTGFSGNYTIKLYTNPAEANGIDYTAMSAIKKHDGDANFTTIANVGNNASDANGNYIQSGTLTNFSVFGLTNASSPLAITWNKVNASLNTANQAVISWSVSEKEVAAYNVQKSTDGTAFETIATLKSKGDGNNNYSFTEPQTLTSKAWYRIAQQTVYDNVNYSSVMMLSNNTANNHVSIYPNPASQVLNINVTESDVTYTIFDLQGKMIAKGLLQSGKNTINVASFAKGIYTIKIGDSNQKIVLQ